jgi:hypothetical protein
VEKRPSGECTKNGNVNPQKTEEKSLGQTPRHRGPQIAHSTIPIASSRTVLEYNRSCAAEKRILPRFSIFPSPSQNPHSTSIKTLSRFAASLIITCLK